MLKFFTFIFAFLWTVSITFSAPIKGPSNQKQSVATPQMKSLSVEIPDIPVIPVPGEEPNPNVPIDSEIIILLLFGISLGIYFLTSKKRALIKAQS